MGSDFALLSSLNSNGWVARVYSWSEPWVTLGKFQLAVRDLLPNCPVPSVLRPTGGRAVLHGHDITIGLAMSFRVLAANESEIPALSRSVRKVYRRAVGPILIALNECGIPACLGEALSESRPDGPRSADCFAHIAANDVVDRRSLKKICGVAMLLTQDAVLVQASIPAAEPKVDPSLVYAQPSPVHWTSLGMNEFDRALMAALK